jgi:hypothetical protein
MRLIVSGFLNDNRDSPGVSLNIGPEDVTF